MNEHKKIEEDKNRFFYKIKKFWNFIWHGESFLSWFAFLIFIFVIIKFVFFPLISLIFGTSLPIVIVESCSMYHGSGFDSWWENHSEWYLKHDFTKEQFIEFPLKNGFSKGDIFVVTGVKESDIKTGDVIIFRAGTAGRPIIHRVVSINSLQTKGDNNAIQFTTGNNPEQINEKYIKEEQLVGKVVPLKIPALGWIKLIFYEPFRQENQRGFCTESP